MESGQRKDKEGKVIPRQIINKFTCAFNGTPVFACDIDPAISANPYFEFSAKVTESGTFQLAWVDDNGDTYTHEQSIEVKRSEEHTSELQSLMRTTYTGFCLIKKKKQHKLKQRVTRMT